MTRPKCLTEVDGVPLLERQVRCLRQRGTKRLVVVVGYMEHHIREFLDAWTDGLKIDYVKRLFSKHPDWASHRRNLGKSEIQTLHRTSPSRIGPVDSVGANRAL